MLDVGGGSGAFSYVFVGERPDTAPSLSTRWSPFVNRVGDGGQARRLVWSRRCWSSRRSAGLARASRPASPRTCR